MTIRSLGIAGSGKMAAEIFKLALDSDLELVLWARRADALPPLEEDLLRKLRRKAKKGGEAGQEAEARLAQVRFTTDLAELGRCDVISESIAESLAAKRQFFAALEEVAGPDSIFTTNTSSLSPSSIAVATRRPDRFAGLHFFSPISLVSFVEVIPTAQTRPDVADALAGLVQSLNRRAIRVGKEVTAFLVNRLVGAFYNEGAMMVAEGYWMPGQIDEVARRFALMGPLETADHIGVDVLVASDESGDESWGRKENARHESRGFDPWPRAYYQLRNDGRFGLKTQLGFYRYVDGKATEDAEYFQKVCPSLPDFHSVPPYDEEAIRRRLWYAVVLEAQVATELGLGTSDDIDGAVRELLGVDEGPLAYVNRVGVDVARADCLALTEQFGPRFRPRGVLR